MDDDIKLIQGDCREYLFACEPDSIDLTVTSPPYDNLRTYNDSSSWGWAEFSAVAAGLWRVTKPGGVVVWVVGDATIKGSETGTSFKQALFFKELGFNLHDTMIYERFAMPNNAKRYGQDFEYMFVLSNGKVEKFNKLTEACKYAGVSTSPTSRSKDGSLNGGGRRIIKDIKKKSNIWHYNAGCSKSTKDKIAHDHPAIFPEQLAHDHIVSWSNEGDTVFDPFMGSGTTGKMAKLLNRKFIGIEIDPEYFKIAEERIEKTDYIF